MFRQIAILLVISFFAFKPTMGAAQDIKGYAAVSAIMGATIDYTNNGGSEELEAGYSLTFGLQWDDNLSTEVSIGRLLEWTEDFPGDGIQSFPSSIEIAELAALYEFGDGKTRPYAKVSYASLDSNFDITLNNEQIATDGSGLIFGGGVNFRITPSASLRLEYLQGDIDVDYEQTSFGAVIYF